MSIKAGDTLPMDLKLKEMGEGGPKDVSVGDICRGRKVVLFAVPGAFTPTCSAKHLPGFVEQAATIRSKGVDEIALDASGFGMGQRSQRYALIVNDGKVQEVLVEPGPGLNVSSADSVLSKL
ncbi:MAG: redoxin family protein [Deltaproteobacteria bacterium]|nr:redoxin family protein [Deltaproteobacteria bacterium]